MGCIDAKDALDEPTWLYDGFDAIDYGLEIETDSGALFSLTWDPPGHHEGIGLRAYSSPGTEKARMGQGIDAASGRPWAIHPETQGRRDP